MIQVRIKKSNDRPLPTRASAGASGYDLRVNVPGKLTIQPGDRAVVATGVAMALPPGTEGQVRPRSGLASRGIVAVLGTIDSDYRGEICVVLENRSALDFVVEDSARIAQLVFAPVLHAELVAVNELPDTERGDSGFGSTGVGRPRAPSAVLVCGSRNWKDANSVTERLLTYPSGPETVLLHGACRGADQIASLIGRVRGWTVKAFPADWDAHGKSAGPRRNQQMIELLNAYRDQGFQTTVEAFHTGGAGTRDAISRARKAAHPVRETTPTS